MIEKLLREHDELRGGAARLRSALSAETPPPADTLAALRWDLGSRIMQHLASEDRHLYAVLAADPRPAVSMVGRRFQDERTDHMTHYVAHTKAWPPERVTAEWAAYRAPTVALLDWLVDQIDREERELFPAARTAQASTRSPQRSGLNWAREAFAIKDALGAR